MNQRCSLRLRRRSSARRRKFLAIDPQLTLTKLRARAMFANAEFWREYSAALRIAGIPD
jgi:hypothetical protein